MKTVINPIAVQDYVDKHLPATITIGQSTIIFNRVAHRLLDLKPEVFFEFEFEDGKLYYKDSNSSGFPVQQILERMTISSIPQIGKFIGSLFKKDDVKHKFIIGEFKNGRRILVPSE